jgi:myo-inositol 2-dehydrogenase/D-chiro-inositol 1-dehydrogenase
MKFRICSIGGGWMATQGHGPSLRRYARENPEVELAACCDINEEAAQRFQQNFGFARYYTDIFEMLDKEKPNAVCLVVPVHLTADLAIGIMEAGYPVLMEKPPGLDSKEAMDIIKAAERTNMPNQVAFNRRFTPLIQKLKEELANNYKPGEIQNIQYFMYRYGRTDEDFSTTAIHGIDATRYLAGSDYKYVKFTYQELPHLGKGVTNIYMDCVFESGSAAQLAFCPVAGVTIERAVVNLHDNTYFLNVPVWGGMDTPGRLLHVKGDKVVSDISGLALSSVQELYETNGFYDENASFFDDIRSGRKPVNDVRSALQSVEIAECIRYRKAEYKR